MKIQQKNQKKSKVKIKTTNLFFVYLQFLTFSIFNILPATAQTASTNSDANLTIVYSRENANQWAGIANRLQATGVKYCLVSLDTIQSANDWGDRKILFLPNIETITPAQAIALEEWMSRGGRLVASGPVASLSAPGVRQLMKALLGGYWGFSWNEIQKLQPSPEKITQDWVKEGGVFGKVRGGVVIADSAVGQTAATWDAKDSPTAVLTTERSTFLGWRWGVDTAAASELDVGWLRAAIARHMKLAPGASTKVNGAKSCIKSIAELPKPASFSQNSEQNSQPIPPRQAIRINPNIFSSPTNPTPNTTAARFPSNTPRSDEAIDQLEQSVRLDVVPNSQQPISSREAIALQQELKNLIGRVESAQLSASAIAGKASSTKAQQAEYTSLRPRTLIPNPEQARQIANNLPSLVAQKQYSQARQQWLSARSSLWKQFPTNQRLAQPEIRSIWLDRGTIVKAGNEKALAQIFDRIAQAGINTVFFETLNASYPIYPSQVAPQQNPLIRGWDPLASAVKLAKARGIELHAWVWVFAAGNRRHNELLGINPNYPGPVLAAHPDWAGYDNQGQMIPPGQGKHFFDPANPQLRQYLLNLYEEIITRYDVDGLQLDYIRYPFQDPAAGRSYGYGKAARIQFQQKYGVDPTTIKPSQGDLWQKWTAFRTEKVNSFVAEVSQKLRQKRPNLALSVAVFPLPEQERIQKLQQHWEVWARRGDIDLILPMTYALDTARFERLAQPWITSTQFGQLGSALLVPGIRLLNLPTPGAFDQIQAIRDLPAIGYALFAAENLTGDLEKVFNNTQGNFPSNLQDNEKEPIPHRQPFQSAVARYTALQAEWQWIEQNNQLRLTPTALASFKEQASVLENALKQLAEKPNASKLVTARSSLVRFQSLFRGWMRQHSVDNYYQVRVWENRLVAIERLLRYGERVKFS
ncbi:glycoside hydrolase family 10 protein [Calothrix sp. UHCC 0171]|uniref:glycoside hydrolase family 10 protein n=1 Tax=Calothrix sp. UHCC 0171 TaxID=3110245 RepID=UPI002B21927B|nr:family 10 glycosylhydrolase [Calothrix sp. UHCC 0171]MEA5569953.1 family 10 glycosylhydrolase [Calothrix sp. UHCC 0171]